MPIQSEHYPPFEFLSLKQLGTVFATSAVIVGRWLKALDLRGPDGEPTPKAREGGMVQQVDFGDGHPFWSWHRDRTIRLLRAAGYKKAEEAMGTSETPPPSSRLHGPFQARRSNPAADGFEVVDSDGITGIWVRGEELARRLVGLLNLAHQCGKF